MPRPPRCLEDQSSFPLDSQRPRHQTAILITPSLLTRLLPCTLCPTSHLIDFFPLSFIRVESLDTGLEFDRRRPHLSLALSTFSLNIHLS